MAVDGDTITLRPGQTLDVGGFLKGYLAERLAKEAAEFPGVLVNLGGDLYARGVDARGEPFLIAIECPGAGDLMVRVSDEAVATSGTYRRRWLVDGAPMHHILRADGQGNPVTDLVSATTIAGSGADAEAYSTASIVLGSVRAMALLDARGADYAFVKRDGSVLLSPRLRTRMHAYAG